MFVELQEPHFGYLAHCPVYLLTPGHSFVGPSPNFEVVCPIGLVLVSFVHYLGWLVWGYCLGWLVWGYCVVLALFWS